MNDFENNFTMDNNFTKEFSWSWTRHRLMPWYIRVELAVLLVLGILLMRFSISQTDSLFGLCFVVFSIVLPIVVAINTRSSIRTYRQRDTLLKLPGACHTRIQNGKCVIRGREEKESPAFPLSAVIDYYESRNYFYLVFCGMVVLPFSKTGFSQGNSDQFRNMMKGLPKKKNTRAVVTGIILLGVTAAVVVLLIREIQIYRSVGWLLPMVNSLGH